MSRPPQVAVGHPELIAIVFMTSVLMTAAMKSRKKILQIGNYPPPMCGWAIQTKLVTDELRRRGHICNVLKINEKRQIKDPAYIDGQGGFHYLFKVFRYAA